MYRYTPGVGMQELPTLGGDESESYGINALGQITGYSQAASDGYERVFRYADSTGIQNVSGTAFGGGNDVNDRGWIAAYNGGRAVLFRDADITDLGPGQAYGLNNNGDVVGETFIVRGHPTAFVYRSNGNMTILGDDVFGDPTLLDINNSRQAVGFGYVVIDYQVRQRAVFWSEETVSLVDLNSLLPENSGWELLAAAAINDSGQITGSGLLNGQITAYRLDPIPNPPEALSRCIKLVDDSDLPRKNKQPLLATLNAVEASLERNNVDEAIAQLNAFQSKVRAQIFRDDPSQAEALIKCARDVIKMIEESATSVSHPGQSRARPLI